MQHRDRNGRFTPVGLSCTLLASQLVRYSEIRPKNRLLADPGDQPEYIDFQVRPLEPL